mmetsp:Transcript_17304/g.26780  ORF Transcript_17304/g.26780 Transcript_17304/m.26780 type:complete len:261 (+) Transcript_17304:206-988(+)
MQLLIRLGNLCLTYTAFYLLIEAAKEPVRQYIAGEKGSLEIIDDLVSNILCIFQKTKKAASDGIQRAHSCTFRAKSLTQEDEDEEDWTLIELSDADLCPKCIDSKSTITNLQKTAEAMGIMYPGLLLGPQPTSLALVQDYALRYRGLPISPTAPAQFHPVRNPARPQKASVLQPLSPSSKQIQWELIRLGSSSVSAGLLWPEEGNQASHLLVPSALNSLCLKAQYLNPNHLQGNRLSRANCAEIGLVASDVYITASAAVI